METFLERSKHLQLKLLDCRGQCYDNGANMKGKNAGLQTRILEINPKALFVPCANHSLNLVVVDSAKSSSEAILFFGVLTQLCALCVMLLFHSALVHINKTRSAVNQISFSDSLGKPN